MATLEGKVKAISYNEVYEMKQDCIPDEIIEVVNNLIIENFDSSDNSSKVYQDDILNRVTIDKDIIFRKKWLDIEPLYEGAGWDVSYYRPLIGESFQHYFVFSKK